MPVLHLVDGLPRSPMGKLVKPAILELISGGAVP
ncbi:hypothetical protein JNB_10459 [Janibacter sp. HTCC2649]|nr:hypothetical protein JNB_10459 [Janibacter sp. HTCC2649]